MKDPLRYAIDEGFNGKTIDEAIDNSLKSLDKSSFRIQS